MHFSLLLASRASVRVFALAFVIPFMSHAAPAAPRLGGPFAALGGHWNGGGVVVTPDGQSERIRCHASYTVLSRGESLAQRLSCASTSYRLEISARIQDMGGSISGSWTEATHGVSGSVSGRALGSNIEGRVTGGGFAANIRIQNRGDSQFVSITPQAGTDIANVSVTLRRG
jgi:hypothetical protein